MPDPTHFDPLISIAGSVSKSPNVDSGSDEISTNCAYVAAAALANQSYSSGLTGSGSASWSTAPAKTQIYTKDLIDPGCWPPPWWLSYEFRPYFSRSDAASKRVAQGDSRPKPTTAVSALGAPVTGETPGYGLDRLRSLSKDLPVAHNGTAVQIRGSRSSAKAPRQQGVGFC